MQKGSRASRENQDKWGLLDKLVLKDGKAAKEIRVTRGRKGKKGSLEKLADGASEARWASSPRGVPGDTRATQVTKDFQDPRACRDPMASWG